MKLLSVVTCLLVFASFNRAPVYRYCFARSYIDTGHIIHALDGQVTEWPADRFHLSDDSTFEYAIDNNEKTLFVAMTIPDVGMQTKIMRNGMKIFIDLKGKKKEGKGIEFPVKGEVTNAVTTNYNNPNEGGNSQSKVDRKTQRNIMALGLVALKLFGFSNEQEEQGLVMPGSVNIAFKWDEPGAMHIEYDVPLSLLGEPSSLNQKDISLGWKINGFERPAGQHNAENNERNSTGGGFSGGGRHGGGGGGGRGQYGGGGGGRGFGNRGGATNYKKLDPDEMRKEQNFWTKYIISIQPSQKAF